MYILYVPRHVLVGACSQVRDRLTPHSLWSAWYQYSQLVSPPFSTPLLPNPPRPNLPATASLPTSCQPFPSSPLFLSQNHHHHQSNYRLLSTNHTCRLSCGGGGGLGCSKLPYVHRSFISSLAVWAPDSAAALSGEEPKTKREQHLVGLKFEQHTTQYCIQYRWYIVHAPCGFSPIWIRTVCIPVTRPCTDHIFARLR